jgi:formylglycine-generating enzyme required for sulfatase activity
MGVKLLSAMAILWAVAAAYAQPALQCPAALSEESLTALVKAVPEATVRQIVAACSIAFEPTEESLGRLRSAGAGQSVLDAVRAAAAGPGDRDWESIKNSQDPAVFADYLRRYPDGRNAVAARQKYRGLRVARAQGDIERDLDAGQWDAAEAKIEELLRDVPAGEDTKEWQRRVADGRAAARRKQEAPANGAAASRETAETQPQPALSCAQPLSESTLTELVKGTAVPPERIREYVAVCGVDFQPTGEAIGRLRSAGAAESVLDAVRAAVKSNPEPVEPVAPPPAVAVAKSNPAPVEAVIPPAPPAPPPSAPRPAVAVVKSTPTPVETATPPSGAPGAKKVNPKDGLTYVWIPPGTFQMGCSTGDTGCVGVEKPAHAVTITKGYWLGEMPVTQYAFERLMAQNPSRVKGSSLPVTANWGLAKDYCAAAGGRLPTEAEWEYAARAGSAEARYGNLDEIAWYSANSGGQMHDVGQKRPNAWGLYDTLGNVFQWVADWNGAYGAGAQSDPAGPASGTWRALRGVGANYDAGDVRVSFRHSAAPGGQFGFRCAME